MKDKKCINCSQQEKCKDSFTAWIFFIIGLIATIAIRVVIVLTHINPVYGKIAWYVGVCGFFIFFVYKYRVAKARSRLIGQRGLIEKIQDERPLTKEDYSLVGAILCSLSSGKERINYFFIFVLSAAALILAIYFDFLKGR